MKLVLVIVTALICNSALAQPPEQKQDYGKVHPFYVGAHPGWSYTTKGIGSGFGYGVDAAVLTRYDGDFGSAYAGLGAYYLGSDNSPGHINSFGGQLLMRYHSFMLAVLLGAAQLDGVTGVNDALCFSTGGRLSFDYPLWDTGFSLGPGGDVFFFTPQDDTYVSYSGFVSLKYWW